MTAVSTGGRTHTSVFVRPPLRRTLLLPLLLVAVIAGMTASIAVGANPIPLNKVWEGLVHPDGSEASIIVWNLRVPRTILAILAGSAFGVAGALIQALTRNPLADPGILGVNAGAGFAVTVGVGVFGVSAVTGYVWFALCGAAAATVIVALIGTAGGRGLNPVTLVLAGVALSAVLGGISTFLTLIDEKTFRAVQHWGLGSVAKTGLNETLALTPLILVGFILSVFLAGALNAVALGEEAAAALGTNVVTTRVGTIAAVTILAGTATALTGGIAFLGLMVPHIVRWATGPDQRWILAGSALAGAVLVLFADVIGRVIAYPGEIEVGILLAVIGAPVLIMLVRGRRVSGL